MRRPVRCIRQILDDLADDELCGLVRNVRGHVKNAPRTKVLRDVEGTVRSDRCFDVWADVQDLESAHDCLAAHRIPFDVFGMVVGGDHD